MMRSLARWLSLVLLVAAVLGVSRQARSHTLDTATLTLAESAPGRFVVRFRATSPTLQELSTPALFPASCTRSGELLDCGTAGLVGALEFPWLHGTSTRLLVDIAWLDGTRLSRVIDPSSPSLIVYGIPADAGLRALAPVAIDYTVLGIEHIWTGFDHLLFVVALTLLVRRPKLLLATITAFTVAHSVTLAATVLGLVSLPSAPVEATIALSIVLVCAECLRPEGSLTRRAPWAVAFAFGLLHGFGFASVLLEIGLPEKHVPMALLFFNVGVEFGQLAIIALVIALRLLAGRLNVRKPWLTPSIVYAMGSLAAFWTIDRVRAVFGH
jgi:hydrogenase/urease accessory protein HupE